ncbi:MAG TPA: hypothetical protein VGK20_17955 [Candidatus Binatia bacterium]
MQVAFGEGDLLIDASRLTLESALLFRDADERGFRETATAPLPLDPKDFDDPGLNGIEGVGLAEPPHGGVIL